MADLLEIQNDKWRPIAYRNAARTIEGLKRDLKEIYDKGGLEALNKVPNIGEALAIKIEQYIKTGKINTHERLLKSIPKHLREMMKIQGLGPKKIKKLNTLLKIKTIKQLKKAAEQHKIAKLEGFGEKSEKEILEAIELSKHEKGKILLKEAESEANKIIQQLKSVKEIKQIEIAGSTRRKKPFVRDLDFIASSNEPEKVTTAFTKLKNIKKILDKGKTKAIIILKSGIQADIRVVKPESWGAALLYFVGSKNYNISLRKIALEQGLKLNEYGLFNKKTNKMFKSATEQAITKRLNVEWLKPEDRNL